MDNETLLLVAITIAAFAVIIAVAARYLIRSFKKARRDAVVFSINLNDKEEERAAEFLKKVSFPIAFDVVVQHLGKERENYFIVSRKYAERAERELKDHWPGVSISMSHDYLIFHHGGFYDAFRVAIPEHEFGGHDISAVDLSKINEIGEGALIRFFRDPGDKSADIKVLGMFSAPSERQLMEVESVVKKSFEGRKILKPRNKDEVFEAFNSTEEIAV
ncbi:MAG: hypothetical protein PHP35_00105 [Candidatus Colwellbacteria bacterium]|nr:hypothetical protein [Candidatus Colwellbacteria bacterium]